MSGARAARTPLPISLFYSISISIYFRVFCLCSPLELQVQRFLPSFVGLAPDPAPCSSTMDRTFMPQRHEIFYNSPVRQMYFDVDRFPVLFRYLQAYQVIVMLNSACRAVGTSPTAASTWRHQVWCDSCNIKFLLDQRAENEFELTWDFLALEE